MVIDPLTADRIIGATCAGDALTAALADGSFLIVDGANLVWRNDTGGTLVCSIRLDDESMEFGS
ncbi:hypothetical protein BK022_06755 [Methylorubrum extorquens]|uniref:Uncharacterized protein n=1 Tax=Methylorubrum extorquens TaxID=408 RepID=A0A1S1P2T2_METEX|nr:hypothetical protein BK022_06755 [Methylorubrum extorquens]